MTSQQTKLAPLSLVVLAFAAVYVIWGSTYLAIRFGVQTIPPFFMAGIRFVIAGGILCWIARWKGSAPLTLEQIRNAAITGALLLLGGNGAVVWAQQSVPSGIAALVVTTVPMWMVLLNWLWKGGSRPTVSEIAGLLAGFAGVTVLLRSTSSGPSEINNRLGLIVLVGGSLSWAFGSLFSRYAPMPSSRLMSTALQMLSGGILLLAFSALTGDLAKVELARITLKSALSVAYLAVFGSLIAFTAYVWLLQVSTPARVSTYAFVNPIVAVILGRVAAGEALTFKVVIAMLVIVGGVVLINVPSSFLSRNSRAPKKAASDPKMVLGSGRVSSAKSSCT